MASNAVRLPPPPSPPIPRSQAVASAPYILRAMGAFLRFAVKGIAVLLVLCGVATISMAITGHIPQ